MQARFRDAISLPASNKGGGRRRVTGKPSSGARALPADASTPREKPRHTNPISPKGNPSVIVFKKINKLFHVHKTHSRTHTHTSPRERETQTQTHTRCTPSLSLFPPAPGSPPSATHTSHGMLANIINLQLSLFCPDPNTCIFRGREGREKGRGRGGGEGKSDLPHNF